MRVHDNIRQIFIGRQHAECIILGKMKSVYQWVILARSNRSSYCYWIRCTSIEKIVLLLWFFIRTFKFQVLYEDSSIRRELVVTVVELILLLILCSDWNLVLPLISVLHYVKPIPTWNDHSGFQSNPLPFCVGVKHSYKESLHYFVGMLLFVRPCSRGAELGSISEQWTKDGGQ